MAAAVSWILRITLLASVPFLQVDALTGPNVCSRTTVTYVYARTCAYNTWLGCCVWRYIRVCVYSRTDYCCPGWSQSGNTCSIPICSSGCYNGKCTSPGVCTCNIDYYGYTCNKEKSCSSVEPCYPGKCRSYDNCDCENNFSGKFCLNMNIAPTTTLATAKLAFYNSMKDMDIYNYTVDATNVVNGVNTIWTNLKQFNRLTAQLSGYLDLSSTTIPSQPPYIVNFDVGISSASLYWELEKEKTDGTGTFISDSSTVPCNQSVSERDPATGLLTCYLIKDDFDRSLDTGDVLTLSFRAESGGSEDLDSGGTRLFSGRQTNNTVKFLVDYESPIAPSVAINIFHVISDITKNAITTIWSGWTDTRSRMGRYNWEVFQMETIGDELRELNSAYLSPYESQDFNSTTDNSYSYSFTPPSAGVYSLILEAADNANNSKYVRRFFIYDPISNVSVTTSCLKALSGLPNTSYQWQLYTESENIDVQLGWDGCFTNALHVDKGFLYKIQDYPPQLRDEEIPDNTEFKKVIDTGLSDPTANRTSAAIDNVAGIVKFECQLSMGTGTTEPSEWISKSLSLNHTFSLGTTDSNLVTDGYFIRLWTRATDVMGNTAVESMLVGFDNSLPVLYTKTYIFISNVDGFSFKYGSRVVFDVEDDHSGIAEIEFQILNGDLLLHKGTVEPNTTAECTNKEFCYCLSNGLCFNKEHRIAINNCWMRTPSSSTVTGIQLLLIAKNGAMLTSTMEKQITSPDSLSGIGVYQGPENVEVLSKFPQGVSIGWNFTEGCYIRQQIKMIYTDPAGVNHEKDVSANATRYDLVSLQPSTSYNVSFTIVYDQGDVSDPVIFQFTTSADVIQSQTNEGIATGSIAGIVAVLLLLIIFILVILVLYKTGRLRKVQQTVIVPIRNSVRRNRKSGIVGYKQYNTGGYDEDDIYMYGEMAFDNVWHYKMEDLEMHSLIKVGRFARIYKAKLYRRGGPDDVVAKTLKDEYTEEDSVLMKAKINFFGTKVGEHACVMGFVGAITDDSKMGPIMLLEYCELGPLRDWLLEHKTGVTDDTVERIFRFSFDIARGMQYLAGKEIIHMRLAARNIFITANFEAKIAGFGPRHGNEDEENGQKERVPIKWIAPECLNTAKTATEKSDVWSYGVTTWEIFSMGENPYPGIRSKDLFKWLRKGNRMSKPEYSDDLHFEIMKKCWKMEPDARPSFTEIVKQIESLYRQSSGDQYYYRQ